MLRSPRCSPPVVSSPNCGIRWSFSGPTGSATASPPPPRYPVPSSSGSSGSCSTSSAEMVGPLRREVGASGSTPASTTAGWPSTRGLAAGEVVEELQFLRELLIRNLAPVLAAMRARQGMAIMLRLNRVIDKGIAVAVVGYTDALVATLFAQNGVPVLQGRIRPRGGRAPARRASSRSCAAWSRASCASAQANPMSLADFLPALPWLAPFAGLVRLADLRPNLSDIPPTSGTAGLRHHPRPQRVRDDRDRRPLGARLDATSHSSSSWWTTARPTTTAAIVERLAAGDSRLRLLHGEPLPARLVRQALGVRPGRARRHGATCCSSPTPTPGTSPSCSAAPSPRSRRERRRSGDRRAAPALRHLLGAAHHAADLAAAGAALPPAHG